MAAATTFDHISSLIEEIGAEKQAASKQSMDDPGGHEGPSSHPSTKGDDDELPQPAPEGAQSAENESDVKEQTPNVPDNDPELTPEAAPTQDEVQLGQGVDKAKPTGEDAGVEEDYKGDKEDPADSGEPKNMGGTEHPAKGSHGEKYSSAEEIAEMSDEALFKVAAEIGNEIAADIANGLFADPTTKQAMKTLHACPVCHNDYEGNSCPCGYSMDKDGSAASETEKAAQAGYDDAAYVQEKVAAAVIADVYQNAQARAIKTAVYLRQQAEELQKQAMPGEGYPEEEMTDPTGGEAEGEDHIEEGALPVEGGEAGGGAEELLAAMGGGAEGGGIPPEALGGEMPPEAGGMEGPPEEMGGMQEEEALQQLAMALMELGIDPAALAGASAPGPKLASAVETHKRTGKFRFEEPKTAGQRKVRDYMRSYLKELVSRNG
jgi:hypothetical protein